MDTAQYLDIFIDESREHLETVSEKLLELEKSPDEKGIIEEIFRAAHTLKGMSATMGFTDLANLTHKLENVFDGIRYDKIKVVPNMIDVLFEALDDMTAMIEDVAEGGEGKRDVTNVVNDLLAIEKGEVPGERNETEDSSVPNSSNSESPVKGNRLDEFEITILGESKERGFENFEITVELSETCLLKGARVFMIFEILEKLGEVIKSNPSVSELEEENFEQSFNVLFVTKHDKIEIEEKIKKVSEVKDVSVKLFSLEEYKAEAEKIEQEKDSQVAEAASNTDLSSIQAPSVPKENLEQKQDKKDSKSAKASQSKTIRVNIERLDILMNLFEELLIDRGRLEQISVDLNHGDLQETVERMARVSGDLQNIILTMRMVPVDQVFSRFPRMIRQLARDLNKNVEVQITGAETELDRTVIDEIGDPLVHLIRNAIDHGIEKPEERRAKGKPEKGIMKLEAYHSGNHVFIDISDDGAGINKHKVLDKAIKNGVVTPEQGLSMTDQQIYQLIMSSGFSTAETISDVSGRGVGLDVVKNTIESLGGSISIDSEEDKGSVFSIQLPLTLSIISALLVELREEKYAIPLSSIIETAIIHKDQIFHAHSKKVIDIRGKVIPLVYLSDIFEVPKNEAEESDYTSVVIVKKGEKIAGLVVDSFIGQQEVVLKSLGDYLSSTFAISGATILGDGQVALIVDTNALVK
ncbi:chemotaxis protein CheA [Aciduricibacillus chroicocephali]|uniref:Chemotaxis protein CheA n=1 Tax=Aciduricibacillus chroicocephali TaxID=3054939 RepID=A0ABY9KYF1_9BACI|nr:chemotaxis protein CheA [Bacillaceae bacterium 44XB]